MFSSVRGRLTLSHLAVVVVAMGLSGALLLSFLGRYFIQATEDSLVAQGRLTAQALIAGVTVGGPVVETEAPAANTLRQRQASNIQVQTQNLTPQSDASGDGVDLSYLQSATLELSTPLDTHIRIVDIHGLVVVDSGQGEQGVDLSSDPLVAQALKGQYASRVQGAGWERWMYVAMPVVVGGRTAGAVYVGQPLRDVTAVLYDLSLRWWLSTGLALLLAGGVSLLLAQAIARPVRRLTAAAGAVAEGQLDQQVPVGSGDELGRLSRAFNEMVARLRAARQMQTDFVANVSHELRTPLTAVKGTVETLRDGAVDDPEVRDRFLETVEGETDRLIRLVNDLLLLSRVDSEALHLQRGPVDLGQLARAVSDRFAPQATAQGVRLRTEANPAAPVAWADAERIEQVLRNLIDNAVKYSRPGGRVTVEVDGGPGGLARVRVRDEGIGIAVGDLAHIGERFYRADKARSRAQGGSGLGVAIARALVEAHGGQLWVESREGEGTTVSFTLPTGKGSLKH